MGIELTASRTLANLAAHRPDRRSSGFSLHCNDLHLVIRRRPGARAVRLAALAAALALPLPGGAHAQPVLGPGDDAFILPFGRARLGVGAVAESWNEEYGPGGTLQPFGRRLGADSLSARQIPEVGRAQTALATLTGASGPSVSLGRLVVDGQGNRQSIPIVGEIGILPRVMHSVTMPIVRTRTEVGRTLNPGGTDGNLGPNPARFGEATATARQANQLLQTQLGGARQQLAQLIASCPATGGTGACATINADRAAATALVTRAEAFQSSAATLYGDGTEADGLAYVPLVGSELARQVQAGVQTLSSDFQKYGVTQLASTTVPASSTTRLAEAAVGQIGANEEYGFGLDSLQGFTWSSIGDVDAVASVLLFDSFGAGAARFVPSGVHARASVGAGFRFGGAATKALEGVSYFLPTGSGANALLLRGAADLGFGRQFWSSIAARYTKPMEQDLPQRIPDVRGETLLALYRATDVTRTIGQTLELEVTPRYALNGSFAIAAQYLYRHHSADAYSGTLDVSEEESGFGDATLDAAVLGDETAAREQRLGLGVSYSSVDAFRRGRSRWPIDVAYLRTKSITADGGYTPLTTTDRITVRVWVGLWGERLRAPANQK